MSALDSSLVIDDLSRRFGNRWAVARVSLEVSAGSSLMLTGHNGSGKTTLLRVCATALKADHGSVRLGGEDLWENRSALRQHVGFLSHSTRLWEDLSAQDNLRSWARLSGQSTDVDALLERVSLDPARTSPARTFSAGMRRRLSLARVLLKKPRLLLLDEPFSAFDPQGQALVRSVINELRSQGTTVVVTTHVPTLALDVCTHAAHLRDGLLVWTGTAEERAKEELQ